MKLSVLLLLKNIITVVSCLVPVTQVYAPRFLSHHNKDFEWRTLKPPRHITALRSQTDRVTALFYLEDTGKSIFKAWGHVDPKTRREERPSAPERETGRALAPLFICFSLPGPVLCKLGQPGVLFVLPEVFTPVLGPSFVLFLRAFPFQVF